VLTHRLPIIIGVVFILAMVWQGRALHNHADGATPLDAAPGAPVEDDSVWFGAGKFQIPIGTPQGNLVWYGELLCREQTRFEHRIE